MSKLVFAVASVGAVYAGMTGLCLSMERHYRQVFKNAPVVSRQRLLYCSGWLLLTLAFVYSLKAWGTTFGPIAWFGLLAAVTGVLVILLSYRDRIALALALLGLAWSLACLLYPVSH